MRNLILLAGVAVVAVICIALVVDEGEVVTLVTFDSASHEFETGLWIVEVDGAPHLRADSLDSGWLERLSNNPTVRLARAGEQHWYRATAVDDEELRELVSVAMAEKYGRLDRVLRLVRDHSHSVPIRLDRDYRDRTVGAAQ